MQIPDELKEKHCLFKKQFKGHPHSKSKLLQLDTLFESEI